MDAAPPVSGTSEQLYIWAVELVPVTVSQVTVPPAAPAGPEAVTAATEARKTKATENRRTGCKRRMEYFSRSLSVKRSRIVVPLVYRGHRLPDLLKLSAFIDVSCLDAHSPSDFWPGDIPTAASRRPNGRSGPGSPGSG